ncbi:MAG: class I SAM-dependent methyltransferase [bacterium]|nr:class I SAM-dependent methyltransferase [bacterium]
MQRYQQDLATHRDDYEYDRQIFLKRRVLQTFDRLMRMFAGKELGGRLLDAGSFKDVFTRVCEEKGIEAVAIGIEQGVNFETDRFDLPDESFDVVCATSLIEHLHDPTNFFEETFRVLGRSGCFIIVTPHWPYAAKEFYDAYTHVQPYSHRSLRMALRSHGFEVLAMVPWMVEKSDWFWKVPPPYSFALASWLPFSGLNSRGFIPNFLKGKSNSLLALARKPG